MANSFNELFGLGSHSEDASLEGWWPLQDDAASTVVDDAATNANDGTLNGGDNTSTKSTSGPNSWLSKSFDFNGSDDWIDIGDQPELRLASGDFTLLCRLYWPSANTNSDKSLFNKYNTSSNRSWLLATGNTGIGDTQGALAFYYMSSGGSYNASERISTGSNVFDDDTWHDVAAVFRASTSAEIIVDGTQAGFTSTSVPASVHSSTGTCAIARLSSGGTTFFDGLLCDVVAFSRELTSAELTQWRLGPEPINTVAPAISGTQTEGETLSVTSGTWGLDAPFSGGSNGTVTYAYQWTRSNDAGGTGEADISGATSSTYTLQAADVGKFIRCRVAASNTGGNDSAADTNSNMSGAIAAIGGGFQSAWAARSNVLIGASGY